MKLKLRARLLMSFGAVLVLTLVLALWSAWQLRSLMRNTSELANDWLPSVAVSGELDHALYGIRLGYVRLALSPDAGLRRRADEAISKNRKAYEVAWQRYQPLISSAEERQAAVDTDAAFQRYLADGVEMHRLIDAGQQDQVVAMNTGSMQQHGRDVAERIEKLIAVNRAGAEAEAQNAHATFRSSLISIAGAAVLAIVIGLLLAWRLAVDLGRRVGSAAEAASLFADGDLTHEIRIEGHDEVAGMLGAMASMQQQLGRLVVDVRENAESVATASAEISQGNADLSSRTEQQASALQQTAASMEEISGTARQNADNAAQASQLASQAVSEAATGSSVVGEVIETMHAIEKASREVEEITGVIDSIAFQTNILALNAAVEAARAGEQGRGFAVVASEVRALASRSAEAAKQIKTLIQRSVQQVSSGSALVDKAGMTMEQVKTSVQRVNDIVGEIASGSREQMSGVGQISDAVAHMDQATQQNAALVEQSAAAAESLSQQADTLVRLMSVFRTGAPTAASASTSARRVQVPAGKPAPRAAAAAATGTDGDWSSF